jgi:hypothetical protein
LPSCQTWKVSDDHGEAQPNEQDAGDACLAGASLAMPQPWAGLGLWQSAQPLRSSSLIGNGADRLQPLRQSSVKGGVLSR